MGNKVAHVEIRARDADAARAFYGELFDWSFPEAPEPGYTYIETGLPDAVPGGIGRAQGGGQGHVTFFVDVADVEAALAKAASLGASIVLPAGTWFISAAAYDALGDGPPAAAVAVVVVVGAQQGFLPLVLK